LSSRGSSSSSHGAPRSKARYAGRFPTELLSDGTRNTTRYSVTRHTTHVAIPLAETTLCGREIRNDLRIVLEHVRQRVTTATGGDSSRPRVLVTDLVE